MKFSHVFISRPRQEAGELAGLLAPLGLHAIVQPAFEYLALDARVGDPAGFAKFEAAAAGDLVVFTSPRAVEHGLAQIPPALLPRLRVAAIGPATAAALAAAGIAVAVSAGTGYTSEALLAALAVTRGATQGTAQGTTRASKPQGRAFVVAAPGGREALLDGLSGLGWQASMLMVYRAEPAPLDRAALAGLEAASGVLSIWTSGNAMQALAQNLPPTAWLKLRRGEWLVISERLRRLARTWGPSRIHLAEGPGNRALLAAVRSLL